MKFIEKHIYDKRANDEISIASNIEKSNAANLPNKKAWGTKKESYYSTDYVDRDYTFLINKEIVGAEIEVQDARILQINLAERLDDIDFGFDLIIARDCNIKVRKINEHIKIDLSKFSAREQQELLRKESPEFVPLAMDLQARLYEMKTELALFSKSEKEINLQDFSTVYLMKAKYPILLQYCTNICFYLILKATKEYAISHPVIQKLALYRKLVSKFEEYQKCVYSEIKRMLQRNKNKNHLDYSTGYSNLNIEKNIANYNINVPIELNKYQIERKIKHEVILEGVLNIDQNNKIEHVIEKLDDFNHDNLKNKIDKRVITYQISKNKGLTPYRKKEQRNPRVKHRNKYHKAKMCRKGAIREIKKHDNKYEGEMSGIRTTINKSIKLK